jgi:hypothetical protein
MKKLIILAIVTMFALTSVAAAGQTSSTEKKENFENTHGYLSP